MRVEINLDKYSHVQPGWRKAMHLMDDVLDRHGAEIYDYSCGKYWDAGQAICREAYGVEWNKHPDFLSANDADHAPEEYLAAADKISKEIPEWMIDHEQ